jgi:hypothetical protein
MSPVFRSFAIAAWALFGGAACTSLDRFDTDGSAAYCGPMIGSPAFHEGVLPEGVPPTLRLRMTLDIDALRERTARAYGDVDASSRNETRPAQTVVVGHFTTDDASDGLCASSGTVLLDNAPLRAIPELDHDPLSTLEFGEGRDYNFFAWVDSTCQGTLLCLVSLMRNDGIEVRLLKPAAMPPPDAQANQRPGFALFSLNRRDEGCGF